MVKEFIMQMRPWFDESEKEALVDLMDNETFLTELVLMSLFILLIEMPCFFFKYSGEYKLISLV